MRQKQVKELKKMIVESYLSDKEREKIYNEVKDKEGDTRKLMRQKIWERGSRRDLIYRNAKEIFKSTPSNQKNIIEVGGL